MSCKDLNNIMRFWAMIGHSGEFKNSLNICGCKHVKVGLKVCSLHSLNVENSWLYTSDLRPMSQFAHSSSHPSFPWHLMPWINSLKASSTSMISDFSTLSTCRAPHIMGTSVHTATYGPTRSSWLPATQLVPNLLQLHYSPHSNISVLSLAKATVLQTRVKNQGR